MERIVRYTQPTKYDKAAQGSLWECQIDPSCSSLYVQVNVEQDSPKWVPIGFFLETIFKKRLYDESFMKRALADYHNNKR